MMKGVKFNDVHSYYDLNLILSECEISPAKPKTNYINISGVDGTKDLTKALGEVKYNDRTGKLVFSVLPFEDFESKKSEIANFLNGVYFDKITLDKDPDYYYQGRCSINDWKCDGKVGKITVDMVLKPWKLKQELTTKVINGMFEGEIILSVEKMPVMPTFTINDTAIIIYGESVWDISAGTYKFPEMYLTKGEHSVMVQTFESTSELTISYQEGSL